MKPGGPVRQPCSFSVPIAPIDCSKIPTHKLRKDLALLTVRFIFTLHLSDFYLRNVEVAGELLSLSFLPGRHRNNPEFFILSLKDGYRKNGWDFLPLSSREYTVKKVCDFPVPSRYGTNQTRLVT
jgi:hypothetical protein